MNEGMQPSTPAPDTLWYYADASNEPVGPLPMDVLQKLAAAEVISQETYVIKKGASEWEKFGSVAPSLANDAHARSNERKEGSQRERANASTETAARTAPQDQQGAFLSKRGEKIAWALLIPMTMFGLFLKLKSCISDKPGGDSAGEVGKGKTSEELAKSDRIVTDIKNAPIEYQLAFLDSGHFPKGNDINAARIRYLLKAISAKTRDSAETIGDTAQRANAVLKADYGRIVTIQSFLEQANHVYDSRAFESGAQNGSGIKDLAPILIGLMRR